MRARAVLTGLGLLACLGCEEPTDDPDRVQPPEDDDAEVDYAFTGVVDDMRSGEPIQGFEVGIGGLRDTTNAKGQYVVRSPADAPQQVDFYENEFSVTSYLDCEREHDHSVWSSSSVARGAGSVEVAVALSGFVDSGTVSGSWVRELVGGGFYFSRFKNRTPTEGDDGVWTIQLETDPAVRWWLSVAELDGSVVSWGMASGGAIDAGSEPVLDLTLTADDLVAGVLDGDLDPRVTQVELWQAVAPIENWWTLELPVLATVATGQDVALQWVDSDEPLEVEVGVQRSDQECDWHEQTFEVELAGPSERLVVPELFAIPRLDSTTGDVWAFRPEVTWSNFQDDPDGVLWQSAYLWVYPPAGDSFRWSLRPDPTCGPEVGVWPDGFSDVPAWSMGSAYASVSGPFGSASCSKWFEWDAL